MEAERIPRSRFITVISDSHSEIIAETEEGPPDVSEDPKASAACESLRFCRFPKNCCRQTDLLYYKAVSANTFIHRVY